MDGGTGILLVDPIQFLAPPLVGVAFGGVVQPDPVAIPIPNNPILVGSQLFAQGALLDFDPLAMPAVGLTNGLIIAPQP